MLKKLWIGLVLIALIIAIGICIIGWLAFSREGIQSVPTLRVNMASIASLKKKLGSDNFMFFDVGSRNLDITLTKDEVNAAFSLYLSGSTLARLFMLTQNSDYQPGAEVNYLEFSNGELTAYIRYKLDKPTIFGGYLNIKAKLTPAIESKQLTLVFDTLEVGRLHIPSFMVNFVLRLSHGALNDLNSVKTLVNSITYLKTGNNEVKIRFAGSNNANFLDFLGKTLR